MEIIYKNFELPDDFGIDIPFEDLLKYEIANSFLCQWVSIDFMQDLLAKQMVKKVKRKYKNYIDFSKKLKNK